MGTSSQGSMEYKEKNSKGEQEVRAGWELKEKESRRD